MARPQAAPPGIAVIGCGAWGRNHVRTLAALGALSAVNDAHGDRAAAAAAAAGVEVRSFEDVLAETAIDGVVIATPDGTHAELAAAALEAGKHVLVEKPMATSVAEGAHLAALAEDRGLVLMAGHILLFHPGFLRLVDLARGGALGSVRHIASKRLHIARGEPRHALWDLAPHDVSMILALTGALPAAVQGFAAAPIAGAPPQEARLLLTFAGGVSADISLSAVHPIKLHQIAVAGTSAYGIFEDSAEWADKLRLVRPGLGGYGSADTQASVEAMPLDPSEPLRLELEAFLDAIGGGGTPASGPGEALDVVRVVAAAERSIAQGIAVNLDRAPHDNLET
ncbi:MAG: Gfo/Idh/MocA family oxidoreductase [Alphaproteobacteria bacterium]|nr:Gfo/Idh/MocA family oxidoreductase [Alphaproteobacteria bacterium]